MNVLSTFGIIKITIYVHLTHLFYFFFQCQHFLVDILSGISIHWELHQSYSGIIFNKFLHINKYVIKRSCCFIPQFYLIILAFSVSTNINFFKIFVTATAFYCKMWTIMSPTNILFKLSNGILFLFLILFCFSTITKSIIINTLKPKSLLV